MGRSVSLIEVVTCCLLSAIIFVMTSQTGALMFLNCSIFSSFSGFPPEEDFLEKLKGIDGVSTIETQTITNMEI